MAHLKFGFRLPAAICMCMAMLFHSAAADLDYSRVHLVDMDKTYNNFLFRGNFPKNSSGYAIDELMMYMVKRAAVEGGVALPQEYDLRVISLDNGFEADYYTEVEFFQQHSSYAGHALNLTQWPLVGAVLPPTLVDHNTTEYLLNNPDVLWGVDHLPDRIALVNNWIHSASPTGRPQVIYWHCEAGCDRTGEISGAYYVAYENYNITAAFARDTVECGRPPNYFSKGALMWYCLYYEKYDGRDIGNCLTF